MLEFIVILALFILNIVFTLLIKDMKNNIAAGFDLVIIGGMLAGYWFGWQWGFAIAMLFRFSVYATTLEFDTGMIYAIPCAGLAGIVGAIVGFFNLPIFFGAVAAVLTYMLVYYMTRIIVFGDNNFIMMCLEAFGLIVVNIGIFRFFV
ncbi:hypothetical protein H6503_00750 [Candidatus Woesearchaeota archaeon]|nr:hypothetical protein [Candidatus Woesearchaeota archaeon]